MGGRKSCDVYLEAGALGWVTLYLKDLAIQTCPPTIQSPGFQAQTHLPATPPRRPQALTPQALLRNFAGFTAFPGWWLYRNLNSSKQSPHLFAPRLKIPYRQAAPKPAPHPGVLIHTLFLQGLSRYRGNFLALSITSFKSLPNILWTPHPSVPKQAPPALLQMLPPLHLPPGHPGSPTIPRGFSPLCLTSEANPVIQAWPWFPSPFPGATCPRPLLCAQGGPSYSGDLLPIISTPLWSCLI